MPKHPFLIFCLVFVQLTFSQTDKTQVDGQNYFIIGTGSRGGNYYKTGQFIASQYEKAFPKRKFLAIETNGSNENINLLKKNAIDLAIVQRNVLINSLYDEEKGIKNLDVVAPLFQEKLQVYLHGTKAVPLHSLDSLAKTKPLKIGFTSKTGYSYTFFQKVLKFLNIDRSHIQSIEKNYDSLVSNFKHHQLDAIVSFSLPLRAIDSFPDVQKAYLTTQEADMIARRIHNVQPALVDNNKKHYTLGSWSFLIGLRSSLQNLKPHKKLIGAFLTEPKDHNYTYFHHLIKKTYQEFKQNKHQEILQLRNLPLSAGLHAIAGLKVINWAFYLRLLFILLLISGIYYLYQGRFFPKINLLYFWHRYKHFQFGFILLIIIYFASIELMVYAEKVFYHDIGLKSQILNMTRKDLHSWLLVTTVTGNSNGVFPLSLLGKGMLALNSLNFWIGTILIGVSEFVTYKMNKKRKQGIMKTKFKNHLVLFGWNGTTEKFVTEIIADAKEFHNKKIRIVCVVPDITKVLDNHPQIKTLFDQKKIDIIQGDALNSHILDLTNIEFAETIILLSEDRSKLSDEHVALRAHAISRYVKMKKNDGKAYKATLIEKLNDTAKKIFSKKPKKTDSGYKKYQIEAISDRAYMIAEINNEDFRESLIDAGVNEIVVAGNYRKAIMKQSLFNHGISKVIDEIMQYNEYNEFYKIDLSLPENKHLVGKTFDELLVALRKHGILLIGVHIVFHDENDNIIIDQSVIQQLLKEEENVTRDIIVNPVDETERNRPVDGDDHLIVLAINAGMLKKGIQLVTF